MTWYNLASLRTAAIGALFAVTLSGCLRHENDPGQGGLTIGENKELDEAAAMLDARAKAPTPPNTEQTKQRAAQPGQPAKP